MQQYTEDGKIYDHLVKERDTRFKISTEEIRNKRMDIPATAVAEGADAWKKGEFRQFTISAKIDSARHKHQRQ